MATRQLSLLTYHQLVRPNGTHGNPNSQHIRSLWASGFGDVQGKVNFYQIAGIKLASIHIEYGSQDRFGWIPDGSRFFAQLLRQHDIPVVEVDHQGGHDLAPLQVRHIIEFFTKAFQQAES